MHRIFIRRAGIGENNKPWAQGTIDLDKEGQETHIRMGGAPTTRVTGILNNIPDEKVALLKVGDLIEVEHADVSMTSKVFVDDEGADRRSVNVSISVGGTLKRTAARPVTCDW